MGAFMKNSVFSRLSQKIGASPGEIIFIGETQPEKQTIYFHQFNKDGYKMTEIHTLEELNRISSKDYTQWLQVIGFGSESILKSISNQYNISQLTMEDIFNHDHRPKIDINGDSIFIILKVLTMDENHILRKNQISLVQKKDILLTFQSEETDVFLPLLARLKDPIKRIRSRGIDYLTYSIVDVVVDTSYAVLGEFHNSIDDFEERIFENPEKDLQKQIYRMKRELLSFRQKVFPIQDITRSILTSETSLITAETLVYYRDVKDHITQILEGSDHYNSLFSNLIETYLSQVNTHNNEVMKFLTLIASIFIPLTFLAGIYGMNFVNMPELSWYYGYYALLLLMIVVVVVLLVFFRRKQWF